MSVATPCWPWPRLRKSDGRALAGREYAYRLVWQAANGPIPEGLIAHHLCENPACVRPDHLEWITQAEHAASHLADRNRKRLRAKCANGHLYTPENTGWINSARGRYRCCKTCAAANSRRYREKRNS